MKQKPTGQALLSSFATWGPISCVSNTSDCDIAWRHTFYCGATSVRVTSDMTD